MFGDASLNENDNTVLMFSLEFSIAFETVQRRRKWEKMVNKISADSRLFKHTAASEPKFTGERTVIPRHPSMIPDNSCAPEPTIPSARTGSPLRKSDSFYRMFHSTGAIAAIRGDAPMLATQSTSANSSVRRGSDCAVLSPSATNPQQPLGPSNDSAVGSRSRTPERSSSVGGIRRHGHANMTTEERDTRGCWLAKPLSDGSRYTKTKRMFTAQSQWGGVGSGGGGGRDSPARSGSREPAARDESPIRAGRRVFTPREGIVGSSCTVVAAEKPHVPHRVQHFHHTDPPFRTADTPPLEGGVFTGLMGIGPSGRRHIPSGDTAELLWHTESSWRNDPHRRGPQLVAGYSHKSVETTNLAAYTAEQLNEKKFRPSVVVMHGPPPFRPQSPARGRSPSRGVGAPRDSDIFPVGGIPNVPFPHMEMPVMSRSIGSFSPLRQKPPNSTS